MKKFIHTIALLMLLWSCGGGNETPPPVSVNNAPTTPTLVYPTNNLLCVENPIECKWNASIDSDVGDVITYQLEVAENIEFTQGKQIFSGTTLTQSVPLLEDVAYYWRVKASDSEDSSSYSAVYKFYTYGEGVKNHLPFLPELIKPELGSVMQTATAVLEWSADDVDATNILSFVVYFGKDEANLPVVSADQSLTKFETSALETSTTYYWKVVVKDGQGGQTIGQIWNFTTD